MALITHQTQGAYPTFSWRYKPWNEKAKLRSLSAFQLVGRTNKLLTLKHHFYSSPPIWSPKWNPVKVLSFKGNPQVEESDDRDNSIVRKTHLLSHAQEEKGTIVESPDVQNYSVSYAPQDKAGTIAGSHEVQNLFKKWLTMLPTRTSDWFIEQAPRETSGGPKSALRSFSKAALLYFLRLDAAISIPLLVFIPWYLTVAIIYGAEVTKELTPLWVLGPLILALYIKIVQGLFSLYTFCFLQTIKLVKNLPAYCTLVYTYIAEGKLKALLWNIFLKPIADIKNLDYSLLVRQKLKQLKEWAFEKYLDYIESIWPYYCRTIRFLKKANLI